MIECIIGYSNPLNLWVQIFRQALQIFLKISRSLSRNLITYATCTHLPPNVSFGTPIVNLEYGVPTIAASAAFASLRLLRLVLKALRMDKVGPRDVGTPRHLHPVDGTGTERPERPNLTKVAIWLT